ncbi:MAG: hypothetical protein U0Y68_20790 [Blastocatellia bacterium]
MPVSNLLSFVALERLILRRVNALRGNTDTAAEAAFVKTPPLVATDLADAAFPLSLVRFEAVQICNELGPFLCRQVGNPYRVLYRALTTIAAAGTAAPSSMGPYGAVNFLDTTKATTHAQYRVPFELADSPRDVMDVLANADVFGTNEVHLYCIDGGVIYSTRYPMEFEVFNYDRVGVDGSGNLSPTEITALFNSWADEANIPAEFLSVAADGAAARLAMSASSYLENANDLMQSFIRGLQSYGFTVAATDFPVNPTGKA